MAFEIKKNSLLILFIFLTILAKSQYEFIYDANGRLAFDTTFNVNSKSIPVISGGKNALEYKVLSKLNYPSLAIDNALEGNVIIAVELKKNKKGYFIATNIYSASAEVSVITNDLLRQLKEILGEVVFKKNIKTTGDDYILYIPFKFQFTNGEQIKANNFFSNKEHCFVFEFTNITKITP